MNGLVDLPVTRASGVVMSQASVIGMKFKGGVLLAADTVVSYGPTQMFDDVDRVHQLGKYCLISSSGEQSDFQEMYDMLEEKVRGDECVDGRENGKSPAELFCYLNRHMYSRRSEMKPLFTTIVVGGVKEGKSFLGQTDTYGTSFEGDYVATGFGSYIIMPLLRKEWKETFELKDALELLSRCMTILFINHCWAGDKYTYGTSTEEGITISEPIKIESTGKWDHF